MSFSPFPGPSLQALDGPHHYQIANRGGLIVAVPADILWPDVLRFSTDEGRCWHTVPLRVGVWNASGSRVSRSVTAPVSVTVNEGNYPVTYRPTANTAATMPEVVQNGAKSGGNSNNNVSLSTGSNEQSKFVMHEKVVFTGLVTEPGGRAMAAAVYGYGTVTQRWRVAVIDFKANGMVTRACEFNQNHFYSPAPPALSLSPSLCSISIHVNENLVDCIVPKPSSLDVKCSHCDRTN